MNNELKYNKNKKRNEMLESRALEEKIQETKRNEMLEARALKEKRQALVKQVAEREKTIKIRKDKFNKEEARMKTAKNKKHNNPKTSASGSDFGSIFSGFV